MVNHIWLVMTGTRLDYFSIWLGNGIIIPIDFHSNLFQWGRAQPPTSNGTQTIWRRPALLGVPKTEDFQVMTPPKNWGCKPYIFAHGMLLLTTVQGDKLAAELNDIQDVEVCNWAGVFVFFLTTTVTTCCWWSNRATMYFIEDGHECQLGWIAPLRCWVAIE